VVGDEQPFLGFEQPTYVSSSEQIFRAANIGWEQRSIGFEQRNNGFEQRDIGACFGGIFVHDRKKTLILIGEAGWWLQFWFSYEKVMKLNNICIF
jgi:hypothetical protein